MNRPVSTKTLHPHPSLAPWVSLYQVIQSDVVPTQNSPWTIMPDGCGYLILHLFRNQFCRLVLVGPRSIYTNIDRKDRTVSLIMRFRPGAMASFLPFPIHHLKDRSIDIREAWPDLHEEVLYQLDLLGKQEKINQCFEVLEQLLLGKLTHEPLVNPIVGEAVRRIYEEQGKLRIHLLAKQLGITDRYLRALFREEVGINAKRLAKIVRVTEVIKKVDGNLGHDSWAALAYQADYFDQSHMIEDFHLLLGENPETFIRRTNREEVI